ncbi:hypothetical protein K1719_047240 [Acacia pycnantha]|nr:hypothetical protein K1719_047240 [Acacia pycnantha]
MAASVRTLPTMMGFLNRMILVVADGLTKESCIALYLYAKEVRRLYTPSGPLFTALYLKQCSSSLRRRMEEISALRSVWLYLSLYPGRVFLESFHPLDYLGANLEVGKLPSCSQLTKKLLKDGLSPSLAKAKSCFNVFPYELSAFVHLMQFVHTRGEQWSQGALWPHYVRYARDDLIRSSLAGHLIGLRGVLVQCYLLTSFASSVVNSALATNLFEVPFVKRHSTVSFVAGQPLGYYYASWPLFALSHHILVLVWWCAELVYPGRRFRDYAILRDDVVIVDESVAKVYSAALGDLGVTISYSKSLISHSGSAEFAKRFRFRPATHTQSLCQGCYCS